MSFNENLKEAMYCKNLTTLQLADLTEINSGTISNYLKTKGSMPPADKALKLAQALDVSVDFLVNGFDSKSPSSIQQKSPFTADVYRLAQDLSNLRKEELNAIKGIIKILKDRNT
ncbi:MAG: helix-turn-helix transcriptional regulator [Treponema sp.]|nr:helix-turn-helix transcriptional regulator [Treponema sp.]